MKAQNDVNFIVQTVCTVLILIILLEFAV